MDLTQKMSGGAPGSQAFLGALQDATTRLWKELPSEEQERYADIGKEWSDDRPPKDIQAKYIIPHAFMLFPSNSLIHSFRMASAAFRRRIVRDFQTQLYKTCGMRSVVLVAYEDKDGNVRASM
jgi:hypothetical protein